MFDYGTGSFGGNGWNVTIGNGGGSVYYPGGAGGVYYPGTGGGGYYPPVQNNNQILMLGAFVLLAVFLMKR